MRIMLTLPEEMHDVLEDERNRMMLKNTQEVIRMILSTHLNSEKQSTSETNGAGVSPLEDRRRCEDIPIQDTLAVFNPFIEIAQGLGKSSDLNGVVNVFELLWARVGAVFNFNDQSPLSNTQRQSLFMFMRDDNPTNARMRFVIGGLQGLINMDGITELEPSLKAVMDIIQAHIAQLAFVYKHLYKEMLQLEHWRK